MFIWSVSYPRRIWLDHVVMYVLDSCGIDFGLVLFVLSMQSFSWLLHDCVILLLEFGMDGQK